MVGSSEWCFIECDSLRILLTSPYVRSCPGWGSLENPRATKWKPVKEQIPMSLFASRGAMSASTIRIATFAAALAATIARGADYQVQFPAGESCGLVTVCHPPRTERGLLQLGDHDRVLGYAQGKVTLSSEDWVLLDLSSESETQRSALRALRDSRIQGLRISRGTLDRETLAAIVAIPTLEMLRIHGCKFTGDDIFADLHPAEKLAQLMLSADIPPSAFRGLSEWLKSCPRLEYLYTTPALPLAAWEILRDHPMLNFVNVSIDRDAAAVMDCLASFLNLRGLNLRIADDADPAFLKRLPNLSTVQWINWSSGHVGKAELEALGRMEGLRSLVFQGNVHIAGSFPEGLASLPRLQLLSINTQNRVDDPASLLRALVAMPALVHWPSLGNLDCDRLALLTQRRNVRSLEIADVDSKVDRARLKSWLSQLDLESLSLSDGQLGDLQFLSGQNQLERLSLVVGSLPADGLAPLGSLSRLRDLELRVSGAESLSYAPLARGPNLQSVSIADEMIALRDLQTLADSPSLRTLSIREGYLDDSAAQWLSQADRLREISLGRDCFLTDGGVRLLSAKRNLESLDLGGIITREGADSLASLPRLRQLVVRSSTLSPEDRHALERRFVRIPWVSFLPLDPLRGPWLKGSDGLLRVADSGARPNACAALEGVIAPPLRGKSVTDPGQVVDLKELRGKVVLIDFWGLWCGPCLNMMPLISHLHEKYHDQGLVIVGIHSNRQSSGVKDYLCQHPKPWPNLIDADRSLEKAYAVGSFPGLFIIDRTGTLRVAQPHLMGLEHAIVHYLKP
jgi:thiol-disulfide isomerase/thioredoxin